MNDSGTIGSNGSDTLLEHIREDHERVEVQLKSVWNITLFLYVWKLAKDFRGYFVSGMVFCVARGIMQPFVIWPSAMILGLVLKDGPVIGLTNDDLFKWCCLWGAMQLSSSLLGSFFMRYVGRGAVGMVEKLRVEMQQKHLKAPDHLVTHMKESDLIAIFSTDLPTVSTLMRSNLPSLIQHAVMFVCLLLSVLGVSFDATKWLLLAVPIQIMFFIFFRLGLRYLNDITLNFRNEAIKKFTDSLRARDIIKTQGAEDEAIEDLRYVSLGKRSFHYMHITVQSLWNFLDGVISMLFIVGLTYFLGEKVLSGEMLLAECIFVSRVVQSAFSQAQGIIRQLGSTIPSLSSVSKTKSFFDAVEKAQEEKERGVFLPAPEACDLVVEDVSFGYAESEAGGAIPPAAESTRILHQVSLTAPAGKITAVCGKSGSGKSTLGKAALGKVIPQEGTILLGGIDFHQIDPIERVRRIVSVHQDTEFMSESMLRNLQLLIGKDTTFGEIQEALQMVHLWDEIVEKAQVVQFKERRRPDHWSSWALWNHLWEAALGASLWEAIRALFSGELSPERQVRETRSGLARKVGRENSLSGGQQQRFALAIAWLTDAPIWVLDEPTTGLENEKANEVIQILVDMARKGRNIIVITHTLLPFMDERIPDDMVQFVYLDKGEVVSQGPAKQLMHPENGCDRFMEFASHEIDPILHLSDADYRTLKKRRAS